MKEQLLVIVKPKTLKPEARKRLEVAGYIIIEHPAPNEVRIVSKFDIPPAADGNDIFWAAIYGVSNSTGAQGFFASEMLRRIKNRQSKSTP